MSRGNNAIEKMVYGPFSVSLLLSTKHQMKDFREFVPRIVLEEVG